MANYFQISFFHTLLHHLKFNRSSDYFVKKYTFFISEFYLEILGFLLHVLEQVSNWCRVLLIYGLPFDPACHALLILKNSMPLGKKLRPDLFANYPI